MKGKKKGKKYFVYVGHNKERQDKEEVFFEPIPEKFRI
jgi:hypothetical protein